MPEAINLQNTGIEQVVRVVKAAGGSLVGRTRLQKTIFLLKLAGLSEGFAFEYRHYGPYSDDLSHATLLARISGALEEEERRANWGGTYSVFKATGSPGSIPAAMQSLINMATTANPVALELAATAAYLSNEGYEHPWRETVERKTDKAQYLEAAKQLYSELVLLDTPQKLPTISS
jgi:hypothetical protein